MTRAILFDAPGPPGPAGKPGHVGPVGPVGPQGPAGTGTAGITQLTGDVTAGPGSGTAASVVTQAQSGAVTFTGGTTPVIQSSTSATSLTLGTNKAGAVMTLQGDAAVTCAQTWVSETHGYLKAGGAGTDAAAYFGPLPGFETAHGAAWFLPNGITPTFANRAFNSDGSVNTTFNAPSVLNMALGGTVQLTLTSSGLTWQTGSTQTIAPVASSTMSLGNTTSTNALIGAARFTTRTVTASFTVDTTTTDNIIIVDTSGGAVTVTLPTPTNGRILRIVQKNGTWSSSNLTIARHGSEKINGASGNYVSNGTTSGGGGIGWITLISDGTDWYVSYGENG